MLDFVNLAVRIRGGVDDSALIHDQRLHLQFLGLEDAVDLPSGVIR